MLRRLVGEDIHVAVKPAPGAERGTGFDSRKASDGGALPAGLASLT
jgi:hypothetical protein